MVNHLQVDTFTATDTWTCPAGVESIIVECWGAGGGGTIDAGNRGGGGGGAYSKATISVTEYTVYDVIVGTSVVDTNGEDSYFNDGSEVLAKGGLSGGNGGTGGQAADGIGTTKYSGGNGGASTSICGGGAAGDSADADTRIGGETNGASNNSGSTAMKSFYALGGGGSSTTQTAGTRGEIRINYTITGPVGFPVVKSRSWNRTAINDTSHVITMPSGINVGDLLVVIFTSDGNPTCSIGAGDWVKLGQASYSTVVTQAIFWKVAEGGDTATVTTTASEISSHICFRIEVPESLAKSITGTSASGSGANANPPSHTSLSGSKKFLWGATGGWDGGATSGVSSQPLNYECFVTEPPKSDISGTATVTSERFIETNNQDPGTFTSASEQWVCWTIAIGDEEVVVGTNMQINISDVLKDVSEMKINIGGVLKDVTQVKQNIGGVLKDVFG